MELRFSERIFSINSYLQQRIVLYVNLYYKPPYFPLFECHRCNHMSLYHQPPIVLLHKFLTISIHILHIRNVMLTPFVTLSSIKDVWCGEFATRRFPKPLCEAQSDLAWISFRRDLQLPERRCGSKVRRFLCITAGIEQNDGSSHVPVYFFICKSF